VGLNSLHKKADAMKVSLDEMIEVATNFKQAYETQFENGSKQQKHKSTIGGNSNKSSQMDRSIMNTLEQGAQDIRDKVVKEY